MNDVATLTGLNLRFVDAFRKGSWALLEPILSPSFAYLDGATGEVWDRERYIADVRIGQPTIGIDQVAIHVDGDVALVSARSFTRPGRFNRYVDTYERRADGWLCIRVRLAPEQRMNRFVELRSYSLRPGTRDAFHRAVTERAIPMLRRWDVDVVAFGPSAHDDVSYVLVRAYAGLDD